jgi:N-acetylmuramoyl-L-alanine amidase
LPLALLFALVFSGFQLRGGLPDSGQSLRISLPQAGSVALPEVVSAGEGGDALPLVIIDPGHGGEDPGASGAGIQEKDLVLALAKALRDEIVASGDARVALTREDDRYLLHEERFGIARRLGADLFLSIHADSAGEATEVAGASIYTLSNEASSGAAARFADRVNNADMINGRSFASENDDVGTILVELSQRRTQDLSREFARLIEREGRGRLAFHPEAQRSGALRVLRAPDVPSVLFESGFITNEAEARRLASAEGQRRFAEALSRAITVYFARNSEAANTQAAPQ